MVVLIVADVLAAACLWEGFQGSWDRV